MKTMIIAEAGVNHNGSVELAKKMIDEAARAGVDYIKFQTFSADRLVDMAAKKADYQIVNTGNTESQYQMLKKLELTESDFWDLKNYCNINKIGFLSSPFDLESMRLVHRLGVDYMKIPSGEITNYPYLKLAGELNIPVILSTGMSDTTEIRSAIDLIRSISDQEIILLHCNTQYPTPYEDVNLRAMDTLQQEFQTPIGYSDHTKGLEIAFAAVAMGATVIEKHFTLDRKMEGPDHIASIEPDELCQLVEGIRRIEIALGTGEKIPSSSEMNNRVVARKSIFTSKKIHCGETFTEDNCTVKRPGNGMSPMNWPTLMKQKATRDYEKDEMIE